jgi:hypothetical protein
MEPLPTLEGSGHAYVCRSCPDQAPISADRDSQSSQTEASERFRNLLKEAEQHKDDSIPIAELPEQARRLLMRRSETGSFRKETIDSLRDRGFVIDEDAHGQRISGLPYSSRGDTGQLSPSEVIRMASELEGGAIAPDQQIHCGNCNAVVHLDQEKCPWCDHPIGEASPD